MGQVTSRADIGAPPDAVWDLVCDLERIPEWVETTDEMLKVPEGDVSARTSYREYGGIAPFKAASRWRIIEFEPHHRQVHVGDDGTMRFRITMQFEAHDGGTRYTQTVDVDPHWLLAIPNALLWPLWMRRRVQQAIDATVDNLKTLVEEAQHG